MKESLMACVENQISSNLAQVDTKELGEAIDMIKDLEEAIYYGTITKAMKAEEEEEKAFKSSGQMYQNGDNSRGSSNYYSPMYYPPMYNDGMAYTSNLNSGNNSGGNNARGGGSRGYHDIPMGESMRDRREGSSPMRRRMYMEGKEMHNESAKQMKELESYIHELSNDILEMIEDASAEEKQLLRQKMTTLAAKIK